MAQIGNPPAIRSRGGEHVKTLTKSYSVIGALVLLLAATCAAGDDRMSDRQILNAMKSELDRAFKTLSEREPPLFYLSYELTVGERVAVASEFGELTDSSGSTVSRVDMDLRVGSPELDNRRELRNSRNETRVPSFRVPISDPIALRTELWRVTDSRYKFASERLRQVQADMQMKTADEEPSADFAMSTRIRGREKSLELGVDRALWEGKVAAYSEPFNRYTELLEAGAFFNARSNTVYFVNTEGSSIKTASLEYSIGISARAKDQDGANVFRFRDFRARTLEGLPNDDEVRAASQQVGQEVVQLLEAEDLSTYNGPAILTGRATGVFFHEVLGHRLEGHRLKSTRDAQTFKEHVGEAILPKTFSVYFDPTMTHFGDIALNGSYRFDNEGIKARRVSVVENGVLKSFLMSRTPIPGFPESNGHGRKSLGFASVARQSNLIVEVAETVPYDELKRRLIELVKERGLQFGLLVDDISGGFTLTDRVMPNSFQVSSTLVYKIHLDGREELVRGVNLIGTPLSAFSNILAAGDQYEVFNGVCGAESGSVPVSAVAPAILVGQVEVQKQPKSRETVPILASPRIAGGDA